MAIWQVRRPSKDSLDDGGGEFLTGNSAAKIAAKLISKTATPMIQLRTSIFAANLRARSPDDYVKDRLGASAAKRGSFMWVNLYCQMMELGHFDLIFANPSGGYAEMVRMKLNGGSVGQ